MDVWCISVCPFAVPCSVRMYIVTTSNGSDVCTPCPANSVSLSSQSRECLCIQGYYRHQQEDVHIGCTSKWKYLNFHTFPLISIPSLFLFIPLSSFSSLSFHPFSSLYSLLILKDRHLLHKTSKFFSLVPEPTPSR